MAEYCLSIFWALCMGLLIVYRIVDLVIYDVDLQSAPVLMLGWAGMLLGATFLLQSLISLWLDRNYDKGLMRIWFWMIWYPLAYWAMSAATTVVALPNALLRKSGTRATWVSPDRGLAPRER
jgi:biofilm PGA synthesis N-glycosyltransferase PgaC